MSDLNDFNEPTIETNYLDLPETVQKNLIRILTQSVEGALNLPDGAVEFSRANARWEEYKQGAWAELSNLYKINVEKLGGYSLEEIYAANVGVLQPQVDAINAAIVAEAATRQSEDARIETALTNTVNVQAGQIAALEGRIASLETRLAAAESALANKATLGADVRFNSVTTAQDIGAFTA